MAFGHVVLFSIAVTARLLASENFRPRAWGEGDLTKDNLKSSEAAYSLL